MKQYEVTIPIAGHVTVTIEAASVDDAIRKGFDSVANDSAQVSWDTLRRFHQGAVCYCPKPWCAEAYEVEVVQ
jgi:hypothetical protein